LDLELSPQVLEDLAKHKTLELVTMNIGIPDLSEKCANVLVVIFNKLKNSKEGKNLRETMMNILIQCHEV